MLSSLVFCLAIVGQAVGDPMSLRHHRPHPLLPPDIEAFNREFLEHTRGRTAGVQEMIEALESHLHTPGLFTPEQARRQRKYLDEWREELEFMQRLQREREVYEQHRKLDPGLEPHRAYLERSGKILRELDAWHAARDRGVNLAPMPREVKTKP